MIDFYGLPAEFPGRDSLLQGGSCYDRVQHLEKALVEDIGYPRFIPYLSLHEFETLVLAADPADLASAFPDSQASQFAAELPKLGPPEEINEGEDSHPSARLVGAVPEYWKRIDGPRITERTGLVWLCSCCLHFDQWVGRLEALAG